MKKIGVIGSGSFGSVVAHIISANKNVLIFSRKNETIEAINKARLWKNIQFNTNVTATNDLREIAECCDVIFPTVPSTNFKWMMQDLAKYLKPYHTIIHGTKGFELRNKNKNEITEEDVLDRNDVMTMSEIIAETSAVKKIGCISGPNLAKEMAMNLPAGTVVASKYNEVIETGKACLKSDRLLVYGSYDLRGTELCGVLKNVLAIAAGAADEMQIGVNARSLLIAKGIGELIRIGKVMNASVEAFLGVAGIGDVIATCTSPTSRNYSVGKLLAQGVSIDDIYKNLDETAEGIITARITHSLIKNYDVRAPIFEGVYEILNGKISARQAVEFLMKYPFTFDVDFM